MTFADAIRSNITLCFTFQGRAPRSAFWWYALFIFIGSIVTNMIDTALLMLRLEDIVAQFNQPEEMLRDMFSNPLFLLSLAPVTAVWTLINVPPLVSCGVRRRHDCGASATIYLIACALIVLVSVAGLVAFINLMQTVFADLLQPGAGQDAAFDPLADPAPLDRLVQPVVVMAVASLLQIIAAIVVLVMMLSPGTKGPNRYGEDPLAVQPPDLPPVGDRA